MGSVLRCLRAEGAKSNEFEIRKNVWLTDEEKIGYHVKSDHMLLSQMRGGANIHSKEAKAAPRKYQDLPASGGSRLTPFDSRERLYYDNVLLQDQAFTSVARVYQTHTARRAVASFEYIQWENVSGLPNRGKERVALDGVILLILKEHTMLWHFPAFARPTFFGKVGPGPTFFACIHSQIW